MLTLAELEVATENLDEKYGVLGLDHDDETVSELRVHCIDRPSPQFRDYSTKLKTLSSNRVCNLIRIANCLTFNLGEFIVDCDANVLIENSWIDNSCLISNDVLRINREVKRRGLEYPSKTIRVGGTSLLIYGTWGYSYYHFVDEVIARIFLYQQQLFDRKYDHLVIADNPPSYVLRYLNLIFPKLRFTIIPANAWVCFDNLEIIPYSKPCGFHNVSHQRRLREFIPSVTSKKLGNKIYLVRSTSGRKVLNQETLINVLQGVGYVPIQMDNLDVIEQMAVMGEASDVIAPHGGALTNLYYSNSGQRVLEFFGETYVNPCYASLATGIGLNYHYSVSNLVAKDNLSFEVDMDSVHEWLTK